MNTITYREAMDILNCSLGTIKTAVSDDRLTRLPSRNNLGLLIKEQVELFKGKKQIRLTMLSNEERILWERYAAYDSERENTKPITNEEQMRRIAKEELEQKHINDALDVFRIVRTLIKKKEVPQSEFFKRHPFLASISLSLLIAAAVFIAVDTYRRLTPYEQKTVLEYLCVIDEYLEEEEQNQTPIINLDEIRQKRESIAQFRRAVA